MDIEKTLEILDLSLSRAKIKKMFTICGGASLNLLKISDRDTEDIDLLSPRIDSELERISIDIANNLSLNPKWLNNGATMFISNIPSGWENRTVKVFEGEFLTVLSLSKLDLLSMKLHSFIDRMSDLDDIVSLNPSNDELDNVAKFVKTSRPHLVNDENFHKSVDERIKIIKRELGYE